MRVEPPGMPGWKPMEQQEKSRTSSGFSESRQRKAKPKLAVAHLGGDIDLPSATDVHLLHGENPALDEVAQAARQGHKCMI